MFGKWLRTDVGGNILLGVLLVAGILVPICTLWVPEDSFFSITTYTVTLLGKYLCYALLAIALDLAWGYCGILSLGHGAFFALGFYAIALSGSRCYGFGCYERSKSCLYERGYGLWDCIFGY